MKICGRAAPLILLLALGGCGSEIDMDQARLCRVLLPALHAPDARVTGLRQSPLAQGAGPGLRIDYVYAEPGGGQRAAFAECRFGGGALSPERRDLVSVRTPDGPLGEARLIMLKRFWLQRPDAILADPAPVAGADTVPNLPAPAAYGLQQALNGLPMAAVYGLLAAAYSLVYGLVGRINLAFGELAAAGGYAALFGMALALPVSPLAALALALVLAMSASAFHGVVSGRVIARTMRRASGQHVLVATIGLAIFLQEYLRLTQWVNLRWVSPVLAEPFAVARAGDFIVTVPPIALLLAGLACLGASFVLGVMKFSEFGRSWRAYADDPRAAALFGVDPARIFARTFALASGLAGAAGFVMTAYYGGVGYGASTALGLKALIAAILGGIGSVPGAFLGGLAIGALEALWSAAFAIEYRDLVVYLLLAALLLWRPGGLMGWGDLTPRRV